MNTVSRKHKFDAGHRLVNYNGACRHAHGHEYKVEITCRYVNTDSLGLSLDFSTIKSVFCKWIDENLDHGFLCNPCDSSMLSLLEKEKNKVFITSLGNPSAENISKELFWVGSKLLNNPGLSLHRILLFETTNCWVETENLTEEEESIFQLKYDSVYTPTVG